jgi:hypothetical protein
VRQPQQRDDEGQVADSVEGKGPPNAGKGNQKAADRGSDSSGKVDRDAVKGGGCG